jgi:hypothetical protein
MKNIPRVLKWILGGLLAFEIVYVLAGIILVQSGQVDRWINKNPEKTMVTFDSAWSFVPGVARVSGVRVVNQGRGNQLEVVVDKARGFVNPLELLKKRVHVMGVNAEGVEFRFRKRPKTTEEAVERAEFAPPIEGIELEPWDGPTKEEEERAKAEKRAAEGKPPKKEGEGMTIAFTGAKIRDVREVWIDGIKITGSGRVAASVTIGPGSDREISIWSADVRYPDAQLEIGGTAVSKDLALRVEGSMAPFFTKQTKGKALVALITAQLEVEGMSSGQILNAYFGKAGWLEFESESRPMKASLDVRQGKIMAGSYIELAEGTLGAEFAGFIAEGQAGARLEAVPGDGDVAVADVRVAFSDYGMRRQAEGEPVMKGADLVIEARSPADLMLMPPEDFEGKLGLGTAEFPDLTFMNGLLPPGGGFTVKSGRGSVDGGFEIQEGAAVHGQVKIVTEDLIVDAAGVDTAGGVEVTIEVPDGNMKELKLGIDHTRVELHDFDFQSVGAVEDLPPWQGRFEVTEGTVDLGDEAGIDATMELTFSDTRPLVAFLARDKPMKGWQENLLMISEVTGEGVVNVSSGTTTIRHFGVRGEKLDVRFRAAMGPDGIFGKALAKYGILKAGIGIEGDDRDLKILSPGGWYKKDDIPGMPALMPEHSGPGDEEAARPTASPATDTDEGEAAADEPEKAADEEKEG